MITVNEILGEFAQVVSNSDLSLLMPADAC